MKKCFQKVKPCPFAALLFCAALVWGGAVRSRADEPQPAPGLRSGRKWVYVMANFARDDRTDFLIALMRRAGAAGYNGMVVADVKFDKFQLATPEITANLRRFRQATREEGMEVVACVAPFGYADMLLSNDPNLAEGMPVRGAAFVVGEGRLVPFDETARLVNGGLEEWRGDTPAGWTADDPGEISFRDDEAAHEGRSCIRQEHPGRRGHARLAQKIAVEPWHYYHASVWIRTEECTSRDWRLAALGGDRMLNWQPPAIRPTQDWQQYHATFCSLDNREVTLYAGSWNPRAGKVWFDDLRLEPGGFVNIIRRPGTPLKVTSPDGRTVYTEGADFAAVADPKLGHDPHPGYFSNWHEPPVVTIPAGSRLKEGDRVLAGYNFASTCGKPNNINMCMSEPKTYEIIERQVRWVRDNVRPDAYMMSHDEIRMNGWDDTCAATGRTCGEILADNVRRCAEIIRRTDPGKPVVVWSDMFDPTHNARVRNDDGTPFVMYMVKGTWAGSWEGLSPDVGVVNWSGGRPDSLAWFAGRGHRQVISGDKPEAIGKWLDAAGNLPGIAGAMYTTWSEDFGPVVERYVEAVKQREAAAGGAP